MVLLLLLLCPLCIAEPFFYIHPVNPKLHPRDVYPIQKSMRGYNKIRDLPQSGIVYLDRIKPISEEFRGAVVHGNSTFVGNEGSVPLIQLQSESNNTSETNSDIRQFINMSSFVSSDTASVETTSLPTRSSSMPTFTNVIVNRTVESTVTTLPSTKPTKNLLKIAISKSTKKEKEADLSSEARPSVLSLINYVKMKGHVDLIEKKPNVETIEIPQIVQSDRSRGRQRSGKGRSAKLVSLSRTASLHTGAVNRKKSTKGKSIQLNKKKSYGRTGSTASGDVEFDPWQRIGTL